LDLAVDFSRVLFDVERDRCTTGSGAHKEITCIVLEALELLRVLVELQVPELLLLNTLGVVLEAVHQVFDLLDLGLGVRVHNAGKVLHQIEVGTHGISQSCQLAELGNEAHLLTRPPVFVDQKWLIHVLDCLIVPRLVVVGVARWSPVLVERSRWTLSEVDSVDPVRLLVVPGHDSHTTDGLLNGLLPVLATGFSLFAQVIQVLEAGVSSHNLETNVDVQQNSALFHDESRVEARPNSDVVGRQGVGLCLVEGLRSYLLELEGAHH